MIEVSQATLSRDIQSLGISRRSTEDGYRYHLAGAGPEPSITPPSGEQRAIKRLATLEAIGVSCNENAVIKEYAGLAATKKREDNALNTSTEKHIASVGELAPTLARDSADREGACASLAEDQKFLANPADESVSRATM